MKNIEESENAEGERFFSKDTFIVSKTDHKGIIKYVNRVFLEVSEYEEHEVIGKPHNFIRHPDMPKCIFKLLWEKINSGQEILAYVVNRTKFNQFYWVLAHVTPSFDEDGKIIGFHSNRRVPKKESVETIKQIYKKLLEIEQHSSNKKEGIQAGYDALMKMINDKGLTYDEFIFSI